MGIRYKICNKCGEILPIESFSKNKTKPLGINDWCKSCMNEYSRQYREANKQYFKDYQEQYDRVISKGNYIYFVIENNEIMYIGSTENDLKYRIKYKHLKGRSHLHNYFNKNSWTSIKYINLDFIENRSELYYCENLFISELEPVLNQNMCKVDIDENREDELLENTYFILDHLDEYLQTYIENENNRLG